MTILSGVFKQFVAKMPVQKKDGGFYDAAVIFYAVNGQARTKNMGLRHLEFNPHLVPALEGFKDGDFINIEIDDTQYKNVLNITAGTAPVGGAFAGGFKKGGNDSGIAVGHAVNNAIALIVAGKAGKGIADIVPIAGEILRAVATLQAAHGAGEFNSTAAAVPVKVIKPKTVPAPAIVPAVEEDEEEIEF